MGKPLLLSFALLVGVFALISSCKSVQVSVKPQPPPFSTETFAVPAGRYYTWTLKWLEVGNTLEGYFVTEGGNNDVGFRVQAPNGGYLTDIKRVSGRYSFNFSIPEAGPYTLVFDNGFSFVTGKHVTLVYRAY